MVQKQRLEGLEKLNMLIQNQSKEEKQELYTKAANENPWFTPKNIDQALFGISQYLKQPELGNWTGRYSEPAVSKKVGLVMAGNIPAVGFHDLLCVLAAGHEAHIKLSSQDSVISNLILDLVGEASPDLRGLIHVVDKLVNTDAVIATGSDNTARYFEYYFKDKANIIRKNRTSVAVLSGKESNEDLASLGSDIFTYFGLGCRNVSKIFVPEGYDPTIVLSGLESFSWVGDHYKYANNYDYNKSIYLVNMVKHLDTGFLLLTESPDLVSPISVLYFEIYSDHEQLLQKLKANEDKIQCVVSNMSLDNAVEFGQAQTPNVGDYADGVDTMKFLCSL